MTAALRILAYGVAVDSTDEYVRIGESTAIESLKKFVKAVVNIFSEEYLRSPNSNDIARLLAVNEKRGFPGMLGSIDCMHWKWKNCSTAWKEHSSIFTELAQGRAPPVNYSINGHDYTMGYYLADGIYPQWSTFVKTISAPLEAKKKHFARVQEACRKDVECAFGILQARFSIVRGPACFWDEATLNDIMKACIILHNMIIEDERDPNGVQQDDDYEQVPESIPIPVSREPTIEVQNFIQSHIRIRNRKTHSQLQADLVEPQLSNAAAAHGGVHAKRARVSDDDDTELRLHLQQPDPDVVNAKSEPLDCQSNADDRRALWLKYSHWDNLHNNPVLGVGRGGAVRERGGISCPDHRGGAGSGISSTCAGRVRVTHDPVPIRPVAIPNYDR
uniref:DDE Tnp4 domain-containing protein n=1 Tax=Fagus sylvatica TaxID=28930 RepID=A0A2N9GZ47_FAGSY